MPRELVHQVVCLTIFIMSTFIYINIDTVLYVQVRRLFMSVSVIIWL